MKKKINTKKKLYQGIRTLKKNNPFNLNSNLNIYVLNGMLYTLVQIFSRTYAQKFMDRLGATSLHYSLFNALPGFIAFLTTIPGIIYIQRHLDTRKIMTRFFYISRAFPLILIFVPYLNENIRGYVFVLLFSLMNLPESIALSSFQSFTGNVFNPSDRAEALSQRNKYSQVVQVLFSIVAGFILSMPKTNNGAILIYQIFFVVSFIFGIIEINTMGKLKIVNEFEDVKKIDLKESVRAIFANKEYKIFLACSLLFHFGWQMGWPLFSFYQIKILGADEKWMTIINVMSSLFMVLSYNYWAKSIRKKGYKLTTAIVCAGMAITPVLYAISHTLFINAIMSISMGLFTSGVTVVILGSLLESSDPKEALLSVAIHSTLTNITLFVSPFFGELILKTFSVYHALYISAIIRTLGAFAFYIRYLKTDSDNKINSNRKTTLIKD